MDFMISEDEIRTFLEAIEDGTIGITPTEEPQKAREGLVEYTATNGWRLAVFRDADEWHYIEWIQASDGRRVGYYEIATTSLDGRESDRHIAWRRYGMPGYMKYQCRRCSVPFEYRKDDVDLCLACRRIWDETRQRD